MTPETFIVHSHKAYIYSILFNLISNAIKYRSANDPLIAVDMSYNGDKACIKVTDNGSGMDLKRMGD